MAKKPTPAPGKPAAEKVPPAADAAAKTTNTQGAGTVAEKSAAVLGGATGDGERGPPAGGGGASGDASSSNDQTPALSLVANQLRVFAEASSLFFREAGELIAVALTADAAERRLALLALERVNEDLPISLAALREPAGDDEYDDGFTEIEARSRDGKPFRRAGQVFGADFATYLVTEDELARIRADRGIVLKALA